MDDPHDEYIPRSDTCYRCNMPRRDCICDQDHSGSVVIVWIGILAVALLLLLALAVTL